MARVNQEELDKIKNRSLAAKQTIAKYVRNCSLSTPPLSDGEVQFMKDIHGIGNNLNQAVKKLHEENRDTTYLRELTGQLNLALKKYLS